MKVEFNKLQKNTRKLKYLQEEVDEYEMKLQNGAHGKQKTSIKFEKEKSLQKL